jgi:ASC-1-like (ASCH) protein
MPLFLAKREVYKWIQEGRKTIDVRKGTPRRGEVAVFQSGANNLRLLIVKRETGKLEEIIRSDNFKMVIPSAIDVENALDYLRGIYGSEDGVFTAYHLTQLKKQ